MTVQEIDRLPAQWRMAWERDRLSPLGSNDPAPERRASRMLAAYILSGLVFLALPGTLLGVWNLLTIAGRRAGFGINLAWIQAHGQAQLFGWVGTFILGISLYVLPKFLGRTIARFELAWAAWALWTAGAAWRWWAGFVGGNWRLGLPSAAVLELAGFGLAQYVLWFAGKRGRNTVRRPRDLTSILASTAFTALGLALVINLVAAVEVARSGVASIYPAAPDRMIILIALWGFAAPAAWGYSARFVFAFLGLEQPRQRVAAWLAAGVALLALCALARQFVAADIIALILSIVAAWALRIFRPSPRAPKRIGVYRHYDFFVRLSYVWLLFGAVLGVLADTLPSRIGIGGASRHVVTVGFLATLIFSIGPRILPSFLNSRELWSSRLMSATLWLVTVGCLLRASSESFAQTSTSIAWKILPFSAFLELAAVLIFVFNMGMTLMQPVPAWFGIEGVSPNLTVYFCVMSFPKTRQVLIENGLKTLGEVREVPRSLTMQEAAEADGASLDRLLDALRVFFSERLPRRVGRE